jgi:hypothetical protein
VCIERFTPTSIVRRFLSRASPIIPISSPAGRTRPASPLRTASTFTGDDYAQRLRAYLLAPSDGTYVFSVSSDETSNLLLGTDENPATKRLIAWVDPRAQPANYTTHYGQQSLPVTLQAGRRYYVEVLHHEANLIDHLSVQWRLPTGTIESPIPNTRLVYEISPSHRHPIRQLTIEEGRPLYSRPPSPTSCPRISAGSAVAWTFPTPRTPPTELKPPPCRINNALIRAAITNRIGMTNTAEVTLTVPAGHQRADCLSRFTRATPPMSFVNIFGSLCRPHPR